MHRALVVLGLCVVVQASAILPQPDSDTQNDPMQPAGEFENNEAIPSLIHQVWVDGEVVEVLKGFSDSWKVLNPNWSHRVWRLHEVDRLIDTHYSWFSPTFRGLALDSHRLTLAKFFILEHFGGVVVDMGVQCLKPIDELVLEMYRHNASAMIPFEPSDSSYSTEILVSLPKHRLWTTLASRVFENNWQGFGEESILPVVISKAVQEYWNLPNGMDVYPVPVENVLKYEEDASSNVLAVGLVHFDSVASEPSPIDMNKLDPRELVVVQSRMLISTVQPLSSRGIDFLANHWRQFKKVLTESFMLSRDIQPVAFSKVSEQSFSIDFRTTVRYALVDEYSQKLLSSVNSRTFESVSTNLLAVRDAVVLISPVITRAVSNLAEHSGSLALLQNKEAMVDVGPFNSTSLECEGESGSTAACCCAKFDSKNIFYSECRIASAWMINGKCPVVFPFAIPSSSFSNTPEHSECSSNTTVEGLLSMCELTRCEKGVVETCDCLQKYVEQCFMVGTDGPFPEPCALTRDMAREYIAAKQCGNQTVICHKPLFLDGTQFVDDCESSTEVNGTCHMTCAPGYMPLESSTSPSLDIQCSPKGWMVTAGDLECQEILNCTIDFLSNSIGVVHDCEEGAPIGSHCQLSCQPGFVSNVTDSDRVTSWCKTVAPKVARYNQTISCEPTTCSIVVIPQGVNHNCTEGASINQNCTLSCPTGQVGNPVEAVCVGHGGKAGVTPWAEFDFEPLNCTQYIEYPELSSIIAFSHSESGEIPLQLTPGFNSTVTKYTLIVPSRVSQLRFEFSASVSWAKVSEVTCDCCEGQGEGEGVFVLGDGFHEIIVKVEFSKEPLTSTEYRIFVSRIASNVSPTVTKDASSTIKLDTIYTPDWIEKNGDAFSSVVSQIMNVSKNDVLITKASSGSVIIDFVVRTNDFDARATSFENALADGTFSKHLCETGQVCATEVTLVAPLQPLKEPFVWPTPIPTPEPPLCSTKEAFSCINHFIDRGCTPGQTLPHCVKFRECFDHAEQDGCRFPIHDLEGCSGETTQDELSCEYSFIEHECDESRRTSNCKASTCHNATTNFVCPFVQKCASAEAKLCVDMYVSHRCVGYVAVGGCHRFLECQIRAEHSRPSVCPTTPIPPPIDCKSDEATSCLKQLVSEGCKKPVSTANCIHYLPCQKKAVNGQDPDYKCPERSSPYSSLTPQQLMWLHILMFYRFQWMFGQGHPTGPTLL